MHHLLLTLLIAVASDHLSSASRWVMGGQSSDKEKSSSDNDDYDPAHYSDLNKAGSCCKLDHDIWDRTGY